MPQQERASSRIEGRISWFFSSCTRKLGVPLELLLGLQGPALVASGRSSLQASCEGPLGIPLQSVPGPRSSSGVEVESQRRGLTPLLKHGRNPEIHVITREEN